MTLNRSYEVLTSITGAARLLLLARNTFVPVYIQARLREIEMLAELFTLVRPLLLTLDAERAHELTLRALEAGFYPSASGAEDVRLAVALWNLRAR